MTSSAPAKSKRKLVSAVRAAIEDGRAGGRALDADARVVGEHDEVAQGEVGAVVDVDGVAGVKVVLLEQRVEAGHGFIGGFAGVGVVADGGGEGVAGGGGVVDVVVVAGVGDQEGVVAGVGRAGPLLGDDADQAVLRRRGCRWGSSCRNRGRSWR